ncbi:AAA family ATPase [Aquiflexum gelatinilyticum]|uniref:ATP-binding protein n=1 Tax=Aquiflexum gelatinilyticum TaxID=2961943 RepID=A0A9X2T2Q5_9BACT|nr:ATP-binding protein [Aquiflexum gelatinilyticum]MCR9015725.1 ATP-binding protein [Aquiflexum gelatinilyticum]
MGATEQIKSLIKHFGEGDDERFISSALQIAAAEAQKGHTALAQELKSLIDKAKLKRNQPFADRSKTIPILPSQRDLKELLDVFQPAIKLNDMVLDVETKSSLEKLIEEQTNWQLLRQYNLQPKRKLLLTGPPGCGKTMTAQALAGELGIPVFIVRLDGLVSKYMGESIAKLRVIFDTMVNQRGVYLFDEFDSIGSHRNIGQDVGEIKRVLNSFLINIEKDQSNSIIICATNLPEMLDKALFRRFDEVIEFPLPKETEITSMLQKQLQAFEFESKVDLQSIAHQFLGLNFSDILRACEETIKAMILSGRNKLNPQVLIDALSKRK